MWINEIRAKCAMSFEVGNRGNMKPEERREVSYEEIATQSQDAEMELACVQCIDGYCEKNAKATARFILKMILLEAEWHGWEDAGPFKKILLEATDQYEEILAEKEKREKTK